MTPNHYKVLEIIKVYQSVNSYSPTLEEIAKEYGSSKQNISKMVQALQEGGHIQIKRGKHRGIGLLV